MTKPIMRGEKKAGFVKRQFSPTSWISAHGIKSEDGLILKMPFPQLQHMTFPNETEIPIQPDRDAIFPPTKLF